MRAIDFRNHEKKSYRLSEVGLRHNDFVETKHCVRCYHFGPASEFASGKYVCLPCERTRKAGVRARNKERLSRDGAETSGLRTCSKCGARKPVLEFGLSDARKDGRTSRCRDCTNAANRDRNAHLRATDPAWREARAAERRAARRAQDPTVRVQPRSAAQEKDQ